MAGWVLLLLPFSLTSAGRAEYNSAAFIAMLVVGFFTLLLFAAWEKFFARVHFIDYELFKKRTVLGACICSLVLNFSFNAWDLYFLNFCMVVYDMNSSMAGYMMQIYNVGSCFWGCCRWCLDPLDQAVQVHLLVFWPPALDTGRWLDDQVPW